ncbi:hypothetical protein ACFOLC_06105 [Lysobacter cavernae]|uniref:Secreted protein n=1 Tax=Lysobacter cavernae TaxID=1685901 RepID=A0ABV7RPA6_9GAMM
MTRMHCFAALVSVATLFVAQSASAAISSFNGTCPGGVEVHADEGGPVFVDGRETDLRRFSENYYEARDAKSGITLSINRTPDGGTQMSYTGNNGANGICSITPAAVMRNAPQSGAPASEGQSAQSSSTSKESADAAVAACKSALALKSGMNSVFVLPISHVPAAGGFEVFLSLKGAQWLCTTDSRGNVNRMEQR